MATVTISLPNQVAEKVDKEAKKHGFATRSEFIRSLIRKYLTQEEVEFKKFQKIPFEKVKLELARSGKYSEKFIESITKGLAKSSAYEG